jgi:hypothetical protein
MNKKASFPMALAAVLMTMVFVWHTQRPVTPKQATWDNVRAEAASGGYRIITTEELAARYLKNPSDLMLVDTRQGWEYHTGHMEGALNFPMEPTWWARWRKGGELKTFLGADKERGLVFY